MNSGHSGARCSRPKVNGHVDAQQTDGFAAARRDLRLGLVDAAQQFLQRAWKTSPSGVSDSLRVVRCSSRTPSRDSRSAT